jgi:5-methyltetrahydrofolate--homocysteine methyltransferase
LNAKAGIMAVLEAEADLFSREGGSPDLNKDSLLESGPPPSRGSRIPMMISMTLTDLSGRNLSGHTVEAFWCAVRHAKPVTIGLNCSFGAEQLRPHVKVLSAIADTLIMIYPNAGLPNDLGEYDELPHQTAALVGDWAEQSQVNILGGCCGSTPAHIKAMADTVAGMAPRRVKAPPVQTRLAGLEPMVLAA